MATTRVLSMITMTFMAPCRCRQEDVPPWLDYDVEIWERFRMSEEENLQRHSMRGNGHFVQLIRHRRQPCRAVARRCTSLQVVEDGGWLRTDVWIFFVAVVGGGAFVVVIGAVVRSPRWCGGCLKGGLLWWLLLVLLVVPLQTKEVEALKRVSMHLLYLLCDLSIQPLLLTCK